ncbi:aminotransferase A [Allobacillus sp. GCM10007491]|uniref:Aminotransferase n=1 Tax=Allobacillus saliphilus TaxID=2912308 RepID=A0A941HSB2_9BACI|nr:aminotransferase A [Allobacillus saliphilus]MBR7553511.1 aminotransferase A [Allobacillus saliphilus]
MEHLLNDTVRGIEISGIRKFFNLVGDRKDILSLTIGQPDFQTPNHIKEAAKQALDNNHTQYTPNAGLLELREAISHFVYSNYQLSYRPEDEVIVTVGASQALDIALRTILSPGDEVILPGPVYPGYEPLIRMAGATPKYIDTRSNGFKLTADLLKKQLTSRTKCVILSYPSNPTGVTLTKEELRDIADLIGGKEIFILADEIYSELTYEQKHTSIGVFDSVRNQTLIVQGLSKSHSMTGFRLGYLLAPKEIQQHALKVHQYNVSCATSISQYAALEALTKGKTDPNVMKDAYKARRNYVLKRLDHMKLEAVAPDGAFYMFVKIPTDENSFEFAMRLVDEAKLAFVPGSAFSKYGEGYIRLSYAYDMDILEEGLNRLEEFLSQ